MPSGNQGKFTTLRRMILYIASILILFWIFPREAKFGYEFLKGRPWMHETLIAPFDFPIYKTDQSLKAEKDSLLKSFLPYFSFDTLVFIMERKRLDSLFLSRWESSILIIGREKSFSALGSSDSESVSGIKSQLIRNLSEIYTRGIIDLNDRPFDIPNNYSMIEVIRDKASSKTKTNEIYTVQTAYEALIKQTGANYRFHGQNARSLESILRTLNLNDFIRPNIHYNIDKSKLEERASIDEISLTEGMVLEGERIISKGERVDDSKFQILTSLRKEYEGSLVAGGKPLLLLTGQFILVSILMLMIFVFLQTFIKEV